MKYGSMQIRPSATPAWSDHRRNIPVQAFPSGKSKEKVRMKYVNAGVLLPEALVRELQKYIQGGYIYVPVDHARQKRWGEVSGYRKELEMRNRNIGAAYRNGTSVEDLAEKYFLSVHAIRKIIHQK